MKRCCRCKQSKRKTDFNKKSANKDGFERYCKDCHRLKNQLHYQANRTTYRTSALKFKQDLKEWYLALKQKCKCKICGESKHWRLSFHHRNPKRKVLEISQMVINHCSRKSIVKEIAKCDPLCHNCHSDVHYADRGVAQLEE